MSGFGYTTFCDDVREETSGKRTLVGVYRDVMFVSGDFPITIPKLVLVVIYEVPKAERPGTAELMIYLPGDQKDKPSLRANISFEEIEQANAIRKSPTLNEDEGESFIRAEANIILSPLALKSEGAIKVRIKTKENLVNCGVLAIRKSVQR